MKTGFIIFLLVLLTSSFIFYRSEDTRGMARVHEINGKEVYLFSEPLTPYQVVEDYNNSKNIIASCNLRNLVDSYLKRAQKDKVKFDALLMDTEDNIYLIRFIKEQ